ncbi:GDSL esterase/lipase CPRD49-like [Vigna unguiculata]|uniref:GDSL esterase/lipase CPRD49-like n=1 Tax=Vigna unguiculata TaxID=3917 RepID=UPI001016C618|nr:GDSL esterase/lipase CPRD49-like [Vigna unguiculata]
MIGPSRQQFVLFGSSIVQYSYYEGWGATLSHVYARKADIVLRGYAAWNSRRALEVLDSIFPKEAKEQPSLVIVYFGGNDSSIPNPNGIGPHVPLDEYKENMRKIATHVKNLSEKTRTIFLTTPPINEAQILHNIDPQGQLERTNEACRIYAEACMEVCDEMNVKGIDLWSAIQKNDNWEDVCFIDGIHLTNEGSKIVSKEILNVLKEAEWEPSLYWKSMPSEFGEDSPYDVVGPDGKTTYNLSNFIYPDNDMWD